MSKVKVTKRGKISVSYEQLEKLFGLDYGTLRCIETKPEQDCICIYHDDTVRARWEMHEYMIVPQEKTHTVKTPEGYIITYKD